MIRELIAGWARLHPDRLAYAGGRDGRRLTYGELGRRTAEWRGWLGGRGIRPGGRVGLRFDDPLAFVTGYLALLAGGLTAVPLNPDSPPPEIEARVRRLEVEALLTDGERDLAGLEEAGQLGGHRFLRRAPGEAAAAAPAAPVEAPAVLLTSSGSTGLPKLIGLSERQLVYVARLIAAHHGLGPAERGYSPLPLFHVNAQVVGLLATLVAGASLVVDRHFRKSGLWDLLAGWEVTWLNAVPAILAILAEQPPPAAGGLRRLRFARTASAPLPAAVQRGFESATGVSVLETYGMTEAASQITANPLGRARRRPGSAGLPVGVRLRVVDGEGLACPPGEAGSVEIRGPSVIRDYLSSTGRSRLPARSPQGWLVTGDVGRLDTEGRLYLSGRAGDVINRGGLKIHPREIEEVLSAHAAVAGACVAGRPHPILGQVAVAYVVPRPGSQPAELAGALLRHCGERLARGHRPERVVVLDALPAGPTGKVLRRRLAEPDRGPGARPQPVTAGTAW